MSASTNPWHCSDPDCTSGQTSQDRTKYGRKVISDFFGRNKTATKAIDDEVWHWQCRKGYQRGKYQADSGGVPAHKAFYLNHLRHQLTRVSLWRPEATFVVQLSRPAQDRLATYHSHLRRNGNNAAAASAAIAVAPRTGRGDRSLSLALAAAVTPAHADHIDTHFVGTRSVDYILTTVIPWIDQEFSNGTMTRMPPIEFLINDPAPGDTITDPTTNYARWRAHEEGVAYTSSSSDSNIASSSKKRKLESDDEDEDEDDDEDDTSPPPNKKEKSPPILNSKSHKSSETRSYQTKPSGFRLFLKNPDKTVSSGSGSGSNNTSKHPNSTNPSNHDDDDNAAVATGGKMPISQTFRPIMPLSPRARAAAVVLLKLSGDSFDRPSPSTITAAGKLPLYVPPPQLPPSKKKKNNPSSAQLPSFFIPPPPIATTKKPNGLESMITESNAPLSPSRRPNPASLIPGITAITQSIEQNDDVGKGTGDGESENENKNEPEIASEPASPPTPTTPPRRGRRAGKLVMARGTVYAGYTASESEADDGSESESEDEDR